MTDDIEDTEDDPLTDVEQALESTGAVEPEDGEEPADTDSDESDGGLPGPLSLLEGLQGSGKDLEAYEGNPIAEAVGPDNSRGALHIARGVDGLSPLAATHPLVDIGIGVVLIQIEKRDSEGTRDGAESDGDTGFSAADPSDDPGQSGGIGDTT